MAPPAPSWSLLVVASVPPPVAGQSLATTLLLKELQERGLPHGVVNLSRPFHTGPWDKAARAAAVARLPLSVATAAAATRPFPRLLYLQLGQTPRALARDVGILATATALRMRTVLHVHGGAFRHAFDAAPSPLRGLTAAFVRRADALVVLTPRLRAMFDGLAEPAQVRVVSNGVEAELEARAGRHVPSVTQPFTALYLSNFMATKGYVTVLEAARRAQEAKRPWRFVLAGAQTEETTVHPAAFVRQHRLENVELHDAVYGEAKYRLFERAHAFLLPTAYPIEGQPLSILEAMHFGLPVLTSAAGGIADVVQDGVHGALVPPDDAAALISRLETLAADESAWRRISEQNRQTARDRYSERAHRTALLRVFEDVMTQATYIP